MEILAPAKEDELFQEDNIRSIQDAELFVWMNSVKLGPTEKFGLYAGLDDCVALDGKKDEVWGKCSVKAHRPYQLSRYRNRYFNIK